MTLLVASQIIFNFTVSIAIIVVGVLISIIAYHAIKLIANVKKFSRDLSEESEKLYQRLDYFLENIFALSFVSKIFKKKKEKK